MKAVIVGATGAIGECLLGELLSSKQYSHVISLGRRNTVVPESYAAVDQKSEESSGRLQQHIIDFEQLSSESVGEYFKEKDVFFCTLGTTRKAAGSAAAFRHIDYDYVVKCAEIAKESGVKQLSIVTSSGASASSFFLYLKTKGEVEEAVKKLEFPKTSVFRPGMLDRGTKKRFVEKAAGFLMSSIPVAKVAKAMQIDAEKFSQGQNADEAGKQAAVVSVFENADIYALCSEV